MAAVLTTGVKAQGNIKLNWITAMAGSLPTIAEVNAGSDLSCYFYADGFAPSVNNNTGTVPARLCTTVQFDSFGNTTYSMGELRYTFQPQAAALNSSLLAWEALVAGTSGWFIERQGLNAISSNWAAGQFVNVWPVTLGQRLPSGDPSDEFAEFTVTQGVIVTAVPSFKGAIAA
jgi:hypothetical protein